MRNRLHLIRAVVLLIIIMSVYSCGPVATVLNIESRVPAKYPVELENRSIALFVSTDTSSNAGNYLSENDSLHMVSVATGIAKELENKLTLEEGAVYVFKHYPGNDRKYDLNYIQNLSFTSNSDIVIILDSLKIGKPILINNITSPMGDMYRSNYIFATVSSDLMVYNGTAGTLLSNIVQKDTVYWELLSRNDVRDEAILYRVNNSIDAISNDLGEELVNKLFPFWIEQQRTLFSYRNRDWTKAHDFANKFLWKEAMDIWLKQTADQDNVKAAAAAFNMAVACELTDRLDLALEWLEASYRSYPLPGVVSYKQFLTEKFETK